MLDLSEIKKMDMGELRGLLVSATDPQEYIPKGFTHEQAGEIMQAVSTEIVARNNQPVVPLTMDRNSLLVKAGLVKLPEPVVYKGHSKPRRFSHKYFISVDGTDHEVSRRMFHIEMEKLITPEVWKKRRFDKLGFHPIVNHTNKQSDLKSKPGKFVWAYKGHRIEAKCTAEFLNK